MNNSFSETCRTVSTDHPLGFKGYICDSCRPGYTGPYCENCMPGYYGDPSIEGGFCLICACHTFGSLHGICNNITGQCYCREGVDGRDCSSCRPRHAFINGFCTSCDQGFLILDFLIKMYRMLSSFNAFGRSIRICIGKC